MKTNNIFDQVISAITDHTHAPNSEKTTYQKNDRGVRSTPLSSTLAPRHIILKMTRILSLNVSAILPQYNTFQRTSINLFNQQNPLCELTGCFFYLSQCMWRKIQEKGLSTFYANGHLFRKKT
ncbi:hypothetical protein HZS_4473 [Henneguya salminicola]|nr:hypothetical protein HZS_4473 [Henneguya salminicola]